LAASLVALGPRLDYRISLLQGGRYHLWVRGTGNGSGSNSVHVGLNGATRSGSIDIALPTTAQPGWSTAGHFVDIIGSGIRTVNLWMHESGAVVDKIVLTRDANFRPVGTGPRQSPRGETNQPPVLSPIGSRTTTEGNTLAFTVQATDADGPPPRLRIQGLPVGATFVDQGNGSGAFNWTTVAGDVGNHTLTFIADDAAAVLLKTFFFQFHTSSWCI
jgi:hypothetical protein